MNTPMVYRFVPGLVLFLFTPAVLTATENPWERKLPFKQAIIPYAVSGMETGSETLYIMDYGNYQALHHDGTTSMLGMTTRTRTLDY